MKRKNAYICAAASDPLPTNWHFAQRGAALLSCSMQASFEGKTAKSFSYISVENDSGFVSD